MRTLVVLSLVLLEVVAHADPRAGGFWCWTHQDGETGACAPQEDQCKASLAGFNQGAAAFKEPPVSGGCTWQKSAWQLILKVPPKPPRYYPTKKMCTAGLSKGESCKQRTKDSASLDPRRQIEESLAADMPKARLRKIELRPTMKAVFPRITRCYAQARARDPQVSGVVNTMLTIRNEPRLGMTLTVNGFETHGALGESREFLDCVTRTFEGSVLPAVKTRGIAEVTYPGTFASDPPDGRDRAIVDTAGRVADEGRWSEALADAEKGLLLTSLDGPFRRRLIEIAGLSACHLKDEPKARHFFSLASPEFEDRLQAACLQAAAIDLVN